VVKLLLKANPRKLVRVAHNILNLVHLLEMEKLRDIEVKENNIKEGNTSFFNRY
jgi:hypothetical protein